MKEATEPRQQQEADSLLPLSQQEQLPVREMALLPVAGTALAVQ